jgi:benzoate transport
MNTPSDPRQIIDQSKMTTPMIIVVALTVLLNAMDGFDVLAISFASPGISAEWGVNLGNLGLLMGMELVGMMIGSVLIGGLADKHGRRPVLLGCLIFMAGGMVLATTSSNPYQLAFYRVLTGLGIGGMLSCTNATVAEFSNVKWRSLCISLMVIGYPLGGTFGGMFASYLLSLYDWRSVFYFGAGVTAVLFPLVFFFVPESVHWLARKQPENALARINDGLTKLKLPTTTELPVVDESEKQKSVKDIFSPALIATTLIVTLAYFCHIWTFYFILKWTPKIVVDMGFAPSSAGYVLTWANFGGALGGAVFGILTAKIGLKPLTITILFITTVFILVFGNTPADLRTMGMLAATAGFFGNAGISGLYSIVAYAFPTHVRATGTGFVIGVGRIGGIASPWVAGLLMEGGSSLPTVAIFMAAGSFLAACALCFLKIGTDKPATAPSTMGKAAETVAGAEPNPA